MSYGTRKTRRIRMCLQEYHWLYQGMIHSIRLPKNSTVGDVLADLKTKVMKKLPFIFYFFRKKVNDHDEIGRAFPS